MPLESLARARSTSSSWRVACRACRRSRGCSPSMFPRAEISADAGVASDEAIVAGLAETASYERINLHRPPFHFVLEYEDAAGEHRHEPVYEAHSPFYPPLPGDAAQLALLRVASAAWSAPSDGARDWSASSRPAASGPRSPSTASTGTASCFGFGASPPAVLIYPNGRVLIIDGKGGSTRVPRAAVARHPRQGPRQSSTRRSAADSRAPLLERSWMKDPLFLH